ncbi:hypothetical protein K2173_022260 [Erythroxylum novogranatense]|uniref:Magnesium transporter n=1 Tax=Erythroxylum novogranatense TaxID=1862640 RepID=A0AAV8STR5_9ROSI|nr:hypothetical protein K2173_022260 [Erythroxylum novogranatense]
MGKGPLWFLRKGSRRRLKTVVEPGPPPPPLRASSPPPLDGEANENGGLAVGKLKKKAIGARLWMRFDRFGNSEVVECDKSTIIKRVAIPARDLRILGPVFSHSSHILAREKAMVVNLEFVRAIVTAEEVLILDPLHQEVVPFVDQLRQQLPHKSPPMIQGARHANASFEFRVLEIALEVVAYIWTLCGGHEREAYPVLDERQGMDEIEHLLDDNEDMADLYLTRKWIQIQQSDALLASATSNSIVPSALSLPRLGSHRSASLVTGSALDDQDVEDLEMLLEAYFMQLDGTRNKILSVREYIDDTEDYVNIQLDNQRNELIQLQLILTIASFAIAMATLIAGAFGMNIPCQLYEIEGIFGYVVVGFLAGCFIIFLLVLGYARWKKLLGS